MSTSVLDVRSIAGSILFIAAWINSTSDCTHYDIGLTAIYKSFTVDVSYVGNHIGKIKCGFWMATPNACGDTVKANINFNVTDLFK